MRKYFMKGAVALTLCSMVLLAGASLAANTVTVRVLSGGNPVQGVVVEVLASDAAHSFVTNQQGTITADLTGKMFRLKVAGTLQPGLHSTSENLVTVELN